MLTTPKKSPDIISINISKKYSQNECTQIQGTTQEYMPSKCADETRQGWIYFKYDKSRFFISTEVVLINDCAGLLDK